MAQLTDYLSRRGEALVLALVVVLSTALMLLSSQNKAVVARVINDAALTPVQAVLSGVDRLVGLRAENDSLRAQLVRQSLAVAELRERDREAKRLREMLGFRDATPNTVAAGRVIAREPARTGQALKINVGSRDGVQKGQAVMTAEGLVGKIATVERNSSYVRPLIARNCLVSARLTRTRTDGILSWRDDLGLHLGFLPFRAEVAAGDEVVSSGLGGVFPRGIVIGHVSRTIFDKNEGSMRVLIEPAVDFSSLEEVFVVLEAREPPDAPEPVPPTHAGDSTGTPTTSTTAEPRG